MRHEHSRRWKRVFLSSVTLCVVAALSMVVGGCGSSAGSATDISVPTDSVSGVQGPFQYTVTKGLFAKNGLRVTTPLSAEGQLKAAIVAGAVDFDQLAGSDVLDLYAKHVPIKTIACTATNTGYYLYAARGTTSVRALAGKTVGVPSLGGAPQIAMEAYLASKGLQPNAVRFVALGSIPNVLAALTTGKVGSGLLSTPFNFHADSAGLPDLGYATGPPSPYIVNSHWAARNPKTVSALVKSLTQGTWKYQTSENDAIPVLAKFLRLNPASDRAALEKTFNAYLPPVLEPPGRCSAAYFAPYVRYLPASEQAALRNLNGLIDNSTVNALDQQGLYIGLRKADGPLPNGATLSQVLR